MKVLLLPLTLALAMLPSGAHAADTLASCGAFNPRVSGIGDYDDVAACTASFTTTTPLVVTTMIEPGEVFAGWAGLRVRGVNALWTQYDGYFVGSRLVAGQGSSTFTLQPGTWQLEVYVSEPNSGLTSPGHQGHGSYSGSVSA